MNKVVKSETKLPAEIDIFDDAGKGSEDVTPDDVIIPRIKQAQALSPEINKRKPEYIEGLAIGDLFNSATRHVYGRSIMVIPCRYQKRYIEWRPREKGGGLVRDDHPASILDQCTQDADGNYVTPDKNELVVTPEQYVIVYDPESGEVHRAMLSMSGSKAGAARQLNTLIKDIRVVNPKTGEKVNPASFYGLYEIRSVDVSNEKGDFASLTASFVQPVTELVGGVELYKDARDFFEQVREGLVKGEVEDPTGGAKNVTPDQDIV